MSLPYGLLENVPIRKIENTEIIYESGKISNFGTTICESEEPLILDLPNSEVGVKKKIFSGINTVIRTENSEIKLDPLHNFVEFIFTNTGWMSLNNLEEKHHKIIYYDVNKVNGAKETLENFKILRSRLYLILYSNDTVIIFKNQKILKSLKFSGIQKIEISGDWLFILSTKLEYYDLTFDTLREIKPINSDVTNFWSQRSKYHLILEIEKIIKIYSYVDFKWKYIQDVDNSIEGKNLFTIDGILTMISFQGNKMIEHRLDNQDVNEVNRIKTLELQTSQNLGIWEFNGDFLILGIKGSKLWCTLNLKECYPLDDLQKITDLEILKWNQRFMILRINNIFKIYELVEGSAEHAVGKFKCTLSTEISGEYIDDGIYTISDNKIYKENIFV